MGSRFACADAIAGARPDRGRALRANCDHQANPHREASPSGSHRRV